MLISAALTSRVAVAAISRRASVGIPLGSLSLRQRRRGGSGAAGGWPRKRCPDLGNINCQADLQMDAQICLGLHPEIYANVLVAFVGFTGVFWRRSRQGNIFVLLRPALLPED